jgi:D-alanine--poly(phosphoribitol) ligase subunit 2
MNDIEQALYGFIDERFDIGGDPDFTPEVNMFDYGFVDSMGAFEIISFAEETWNIEITQGDLTLYPMNSVREIAAVIAAKL